jgi:hypothetical protein
MLQEAQEMIKFYRESNNNNPSINLSLQALCSKELSPFYATIELVKECSQNGYYYLIVI